MTCEWDVPAAAFTVTILNPEVSGSLAGLAQYRAEFSTIEEKIKAAEHRAAPDGTRVARAPQLARVSADVSQI